MKHYDVIVVGCGAMGSSVSYNLASRGLRVLTLERFGLNHEFGSSHGKTRVIRLAYFEDPRYVPLLRRAFASWDELAERSNTEIIRRTGGLMVGREGGRLVSGVLRSARVHSLPHKLMDAREAMDQFSALRLEDDHCAALACYLSISRFDLASNFKAATRLALNPGAVRARADKVIE